MKKNEYNINKLNSEKNYIEYIYFSDLKTIDKNTVLLNNTLYNMYILDKGYIFIPKDFKDFNSNFNSLIFYNTTNNGIIFSMLSKDHNIVEFLNYNYNISENGEEIANKRIEYFYDIKNKLQNEYNNSNQSIEKFLQYISNYKLFNNSFNIDKITRSKNQTKIEKISCDNIIDAYLSLDKHVKNIENSDLPLLNILNILENGLTYKTK